MKKLTWMRELPSVLPMTIVALAFYTTGLRAEAVDLVVQAPSVISSDIEASGKCVQTLLFALGYYTSEIDGSIGKQSRLAAASYVLAKPLSSPVEDLSPTTAFAWCNQLIVDNPALDALVDAELASFLFDDEAKIIVSEEKSSDLSAVLQGANSEKVFNIIMDAGRKDRGTLTRQNYDRSVIYIVSSGVTTGTEIRTAWGFRLNPNEPWFKEEYEYIVSDFNPKEPFLLINDVFASNAGEFFFEVYVNGKKLAERSIQVK